MNVGIGQFSYHRYYGDCTHGETDPGLRWRLTDFLNKAKAFGVGSVGIQTCYLSPEEAEHFPEVAAQFPLQVVLEWGHPDGLQMGKSRANVLNLRSWIVRAGKWSLTLLRIVAGYPSFRGQEPVRMQIRRLVPILRELCFEAAEYGITLAIENHADFTPSELRILIEQTESPNLRAVLDFGNSVRLGQDLISAVQTLAPLASLVHLRDLIVLPASVGKPMAPWPAAPLGCGSLDIAGGLRELSASNFRGCVLLELSHLHSNWAGNEDAVIAQSLAWLDRFCSPAS